eukprot:1254360-Rhodomonas_salina.2
MAAMATSRPGTSLGRRARYKRCRTDVAYGRTGYVLSRCKRRGTEAVDGTASTEAGYGVVSATGSGLQSKGVSDATICYGVCSTELGRSAGCAVLSSYLLRDVRYCASICYGVCGTEAGYGATRCYVIGSNASRDRPILSSCLLYTSPSPRDRG